MHFSRYAGKATMVVRDSSLKKSASQYLIDRIQSSPKVEVLLLTEVVALHGDSSLQSITLRNQETGKQSDAKTNWLFLCLGGFPLLSGRRKSASFVMTAAIWSPGRTC